MVTNVILVSVSKRLFLSSRSVISLSLATRFNQVLAMDLSVFKNGVYFLHLIDMYSRFSLSKVIYDKKAETITDAVIKMWIGTGLGSPERILSDNGGEFCNSIFNEMSEQFNIELLTTAANSPWSNGICERNHAVIDLSVQKMIEDDCNIDLEHALAWAVNAKNALLNHNGYSPYQLVYGQNPNLPSVLTNSVPALQDGVTSEVNARHLNALHSARRAYTAAESSERIKRALNHRVRASDEYFEMNDKVYYKKNRDKRWHGPAKVIGQDRKVVFV